MFPDLFCKKSSSKTMVFRFSPGSWRVQGAPGGWQEALPPILVPISARSHQLWPKTLGDLFFSSTVGKHEKTTNFSFYFLRLSLLFSLTEVSSKGSHFAIKEGNTQKHTQSVKQIHRQPARDRKGPFHFTRVFPSKSKKVYRFKHSIFFSLEKQMVFSSNTYFT